MQKHILFPQTPAYIVALLLCTGLVLFSGCTHRPQTYKIGVSQCLDDAWRQKMNEEMERELLLYPNMSISHRRIAYGSNELQCAQIDSFIREQVDLLIVSPNEGEEVTPAVSRAYKAGIPVIVADRRVQGDDWTAFIGGDNYKVGILMGEWLSRVQAETPHPLHVLEVCGLPGSTPATRRHKGMIEHLQSSGAPMPDIVSVQGLWMKEDAYKVVRAYLSKHKDIDAIVAHNDLMAIGAAEAVRDSKGYGEGSVRIMGVDGIMVGRNAIAGGIIECTATYPSRGDLLIETAAKILAGEPFERETVLETNRVDATAAQAMLIQYSERMHDLETFRIVQVNTETQWQQMVSSRRALIVVVVLIGLLFLAALATIIYIQFRIQSKIKNEVLPQLEDVQEAIQLSQRDLAFGERMRQVVDDHLSDPNLNVEFLGSMLQLSRTQIFRRVKTITGKGPLDYIRERRLIRADQLLHTTDMTVQQVAIELCFSSPGYFTKCYKSYFGHLPSDTSKS